MMRRKFKKKDVKWVKPLTTICQFLFPPGKQQNGGHKSMKKDDYSKASIIAVWISLISNIVLTILKLIVGVLFNSPVLLQRFP